MYQSEGRRVGLWLVFWDSFMQSFSTAVHNCMYKPNLHVKSIVKSMKRGSWNYRSVLPHARLVSRESDKNHLYYCCRQWSDVWVLVMIEYWLNNPNKPAWDSTYFAGRIMTPEYLFWINIDRNWSKRVCLKIVFLIFWRTVTYTYKWWLNILFKSI